ncbi:hypothetical protein NGM37_55095 [Streptomyces sp. TRM76130]|nr:hypothetical protein [Streptomyces sp. TRM76130]
MSAVEPVVAAPGIEQAPTERQQDDAGARDEEVTRHPGKGARTTPARDETGSTGVATPSTEIGTQDAENTRSTENGTRGPARVPGTRRTPGAGCASTHGAAVVALAAGPAVPASRHVPRDIRDLTRGILRGPRVRPRQRRRAEKE